MVFLLHGFFCPCIGKPAALYLLPFVARTFMSFLVPTNHQVGYWKPVLFPEGGAVAQLCGFSLAPQSMACFLSALCLLELS